MIFFKTKYYSLFFIFYYYLKIIYFFILSELFNLYIRYFYFIKIKFNYCSYIYIYIDTNNNCISIAAAFFLFSFFFLHGFPRKMQTSSAVYIISRSLKILLISFIILVTGNYLKIYGHSKISLNRALINREG